MIRRPPRSTLFPYRRSSDLAPRGGVLVHCHVGRDRTGMVCALALSVAGVPAAAIAEDYALSAERLRPDRKSTRLNSSHTVISYAVFCLKTKKRDTTLDVPIL